MASPLAAEVVLSNALVSWCHALVQIRDPWLSQQIQDATHSPAARQELASWLALRHIQHLGDAHWFLADAWAGQQALEFIRWISQFTPPYKSEQQIEALFRQAPELALQLEDAYLKLDLTALIDEEGSLSTAQILAAQGVEISDEILTWSQQLDIWQALDGLPNPLQEEDALYLPAAADQVNALELILVLHALQYWDDQQAQTWLALFVSQILADYQKLTDFITDVWRIDGWLLEESQWDLEAETYPEALKIATRACQTAGLPAWSKLAVEAPAYPWPAQTSLGERYALNVRACEYPIYMSDFQQPKQMAQDYWPSVSDDLVQDWQVKDAHAVKQLLYWLAGQGHRYLWQLEHQEIRLMDTEQRQAWCEEQGEADQGYAHLMLTFAEQPHLDVAAWDWIRMADIALAAYMAAWFDQATYRTFALTSVYLLAQTYTDWSSMRAAYLRGRSLWAQQDLTAAHTLYARSWDQLNAWPWNPFALAWPYPDHMQAEVDQALADFSAGLTHPEILPTLVASLRDDALLAHLPLQGLAAAHLPISKQRIQEGRSYLQEVLHFNVEDTQLPMTEAHLPLLTRFWVHTQVEHLDQLTQMPASFPRLPDNLRPSDEHLALWQQTQKALSQLKNQTSGVYLAEKYSFYLLKAWESQTFTAEALAALLQQTQDYLHTKYQDAQGLLTAWLAWEQVLGQDDEHPLVRELTWHQQDIGSLFHWLPWPKRQQEVAPAWGHLNTHELARLNLCAPLTGPQWQWPQVGQNVRNQDVHQWLSESYLLHDAQELNHFLGFLRDAGDRQDFIVNYAPFTLNATRLQMELEHFEQQTQLSMEDKVHQQRLRMVQHNALGINDLDLTAWDVAQMIDLAIAGYQIGWLTHMQLEHWLETGCQLAGQQYAGWVEYAEALLAGFYFFASDPDEHHQQLEHFSRRILTLLIGLPPLYGVWLTLPWVGHQAFPSASILHTSPSRLLH